jgi:glycosyltransferase involved in cell wall biosynthesis
MRIAQVAPLIESVPPKLYGGTERIVSYLTEELVRMGHDVTLFASGDSLTAARLHATAPRALRLDPGVKDQLPYMVLQLEAVRRAADEFDLIHFHGDLIHFPLVRALLEDKAVSTLHGRLDTAEYRNFFAEYRDSPLISISDHQRLPIKQALWAGTVYHGLPASVCPFQPAPRDDYLAFLGRMSPEKRPDRAIQIARRAGLPLRIAAKVDAADRAYFERVIEPLLDGPGVEFVGEIGERDKCDFLGNARALLFPIDWPEPFGLVMIEAMSCGTPCIGWRAGSVPEIIDEGVTGFIVDDLDAAVEAALRSDQLDRAAVRRRFEQRFTAERMARDYLQIYRRLVTRAADSVAA